MNRLAPLIQDLADCRDKTLAGGKAVNLGLLIRAGFPVPGGFVVTTAAYRQHHAASLPGSALAEQIAATWRAMGGVPVAVRSSATAEDMSEASMAGQYDTFLDIADEASLLDAVQKCWASLDSPRTRTYLAEHGIDLSQVAMAVVVQKLAPADVAGVMFGANPQTGSHDEMLIEASWGLGEAVVSGRVQPDVLRIARRNGEVIHRTISDKQIYILPGEREERAVEPDRRRAACLSDEDVVRLWQLGRKAEEYFGHPQDMEWAIAAGQLFLLQSRPITTLEDAAIYEQLLQSTRSHLRSQLNAGRGPWVLHNIAETLKHPTPLTWSVIKRFMSGAGGFGAMYRAAGFDPSPKVCAEGFLERIGGRVYMDLAMSPEMFFENYPFKYDIESLRNNPDTGQAPPTLPGGTLSSRLKAGRRVAQANQRMQAMAADFDRKLNEQIIPEFVEWCRREKALDLAKLSNAELIRLWQAREQRVMDEFAPQSLLPSLISGMALVDLRGCIQEHFWDEDPDALANMLASSPVPDKTVLANADLFELAQGRWTAEQWLAIYGHRAADEFDLATPRWRERKDELLKVASRLKDGASPLELHKHHIEQAREKLDELCAKLDHEDAVELMARVETARRYVVFRENGKYFLMLGYDLLRDVAMEAGRRLEVGQDVFHLTLEELFDALRVGFAPSRLISQRKTAYEAESKLVLPPVIDAPAIDTIGQPPSLSTSASHRAFAVSSGVAAGPARIVLSPEEAGDLGKGYILVCPSTDPGWTPLFVNAAGLVLECGGTLSHGAVIAREMNIPAVVLSGATKLFRDGEEIIVDGRNGLVSRPGDEEIQLTYASSSTGPSPDDVRIAPELVPPVVGKGERQSAKLRNLFLLIWGVYLAAAFLLPQRWLYDPSIAVLDCVLWPIVRHLGKAAAVAFIAGGMAAATMICQKLLTDNARLREAKRRAAQLTREAGKLPRGSARRNALLDLAAPVQVRIVAASMLPLAVLLGPMIMSFMWLPARVDPAVMVAPADSAVVVTAEVDSDFRGPVTLTVAPPLELGSQASQKLKPIRETLQDVFYKSLDGGNATTQPAIKYAASLGLDSLKATLDSQLPPQTLTWRIETFGRGVGRFPLKVQAGDGRAVEARIVLGDVYPPDANEILADQPSPLKKLKLRYVPPQGYRPHFWVPLKRYPNFDPGWLWTYLAVYLPAMFAMRWLLKVV